MKKLLSVSIGIVLAAFLGWNAYQPHFNLAAAQSETVEIFSGDGHGSGVIVGPHTILTARHVIKDIANDDHVVRVKLADGSEVKGHVVVEGATETESQDFDVAMIHLDDPVPGPYAHISCDAPKLGEHLRAVGFPGKLAFTVTEGKIASDVPYRSLIPTDMTIFPGMSGGPVFNDRGELVGFNIGILLVPIGFGASLSGISLIFPVSSLCTSA